jgi:hypothetical protein
MCLFDGIDRMFKQSRRFMKVKLRFTAARY